MFRSYLPPLCLSGWVACFVTAATTLRFRGDMLTAADISISMASGYLLRH